MFSPLIFSALANKRMEDDYGLQNKFSSTQNKILQTNKNSKNIDATSNIADSLLIDLVREYPYLYDKSLPSFKDSLMKKNSWEEIAKIMMWTRKYKFLNYIILLIASIFIISSI